MKNTYYFVIGILIVAVVATIALANHRKNLAKQGRTDQSPQQTTQTPPPPASPQPTPPVTPTPNPAPAASGKISEPISNALSRITKKHYGTKVSPTNSPVSPEKFTGYHTGVDFETTADEADADVVISAICEGKLLQKRAASGYGGIAVQACTIDGQAVTVVYGHLKLSSIEPAVNANLTAGTKIGILGKGYSTETDGERKHLHLGIHKGTGVNVAGYVANQSQLSDWLDAEDLLR